MRFVVAAAMIALVLPVSLAGARSPYADGSCREPRTAWTNDACAGSQWGLTMIKAQKAWPTTRGRGAIVAVVDTGADFHHPDLRGRLVRKAGSNLIVNTAFKCPFQRAQLRARRSAAVAQDDHGHGTHVAGVVSAAAGNRLGVAGVSPAARVLPVKVLTSRGEGDDRTVARGICFAVRHGARVVNLSLGRDSVSSVAVQGTGEETNRAVSYAYARGAAVIVAAGGGTFPACDLPASHVKALCVGAVDRRGVQARYSSFGIAVGVVAPGGLGSAACSDDEDVWSTMLPRSERDCRHDGYEALTGTSIASSHVAGVAALVVSRFRKRATPAFVYDRLKTTADDAGVPGIDPFYGFGRVNAERAVRAR